MTPTPPAAPTDPPLPLPRQVQRMQGEADALPQEVRLQPQDGRGHHALLRTDGRRSQGARGPGSGALVQVSYTSGEVQVDPALVPWYR